MTRTRRFAASATGKLLLACLLLSAIGAAPGESLDPSPAPVYPSAEPDTGESDAGTIRIPSVSAQEEHLYLAVSDAAQDDIDTAAIIEATRDAVGAQEANILIGVEQEPTNLKGAGQLVRGLLLFGDSDALADDWLENAKTLGYVGEGWIVVGIMLPEEPGTGVEVSVDPGRDIREAQPGSTRNILQAGRAEFAAGDYTAGIAAVAVATTEHLQAPPDRTAVKIIALSVLGAMLLAAAAYAVRAKRRRAAHKAAAARTARVAELEQDLRKQLKQLEQRPVPQVQLDGAGRSARVAADIEHQRRNALPEAAAYLASAPSRDASGTASEEQLAQHLAWDNKLALLGRAVELARDCASPTMQNTEAWQLAFTHHRARLQDLAAFLDLPGAAELGCAPALRQMIVAHTDALDELHGRAGSRALGGAEPLRLLDELWMLRDELDTRLGEALHEAAKERVKLPAGLAGKMQDPLERSTVDYRDPFTVFRAASAESKEQ